MNKTKIFILIIAILLGIVAYTFYNKNAKEKEAKKFKTFKVEDFSKVTMLKFSDTNDKKMTLKKTEKGWILNDKYPVRKHLFEEMKEALTKMEVFNPAPLVAQENAINEIMQHDIKVEIYEGKNKPTKTLHIGGPNISSTASYMILEIDGKTSPLVYEVGIPGFRGYLTGRFLIGEKEWRSIELFSYTPSDIKELNIKYYNEEDQSFKLEREGNSYSLEFDGKTFESNKLKEKDIVNLLLNLEEQYVMTYDFLKKEQHHERDSLYEANKYLDLKITDTKGETKNFTIISMPLKENSKKLYDDKGYPLPYDLSFKYIVIHPSEDWGVIALDNFGKIFIDPNSLVNPFSL